MKVAIFVFFTVIAAVLAAPKHCRCGKNTHFRDLFVKPNPNYRPQVADLKIVNGHEAEPHSIPYQAFIFFFSETDSWYCGGVLITSRYVLTAAHCVSGATAASVLLGAHRIHDPEPGTRQVFSENIHVTVHEKFQVDRIHYNIALIGWLGEKKAEINQYVRTVRLPADNSNDFAGSTMRVSGWGPTNPEDKSLASVLTYMEDEVITNEECGKAISQIGNEEICMSGKNGRRTCHGDAGGPATVDGVLVGIASFSVDGCRTGYPSVFTRTGYLVDWIKAHSDYK